MITTKFPVQSSIREAGSDIDIMIIIISSVNPQQKRPNLACKKAPRYSP
jgi:hypothetical protein